MAPISVVTRNESGAGMLPVISSTQELPSRKILLFELLVCANTGNAAMTIAAASSANLRVRFTSFSDLLQNHSSVVGLQA